MTIVKLDGTRIEIVPPDLDGDGNVGGVERIQQSNPSDIIPMKQSSELGDSLELAFSDKFDPLEKVSDIDQKASLSPVQVPYLTIWESLCKSRFLASSNLGVSRQVKRNSNSIISKHMGIGRRNIENMTVGKREFDRDTADKTKTVFMGDMKK